MKISFAANIFPNRINNYSSRKREVNSSVSFCAKNTEHFDLFESSRFKKYKVLTPEELQILENALMSDNEEKRTEAREKLILSFLPLVFRISQNYIKLSDKGNFNEDDIIQYGIVGLINSIDAFDMEKGNDFTKFVEYGINSKIIKSLKYKNIIRLPRLKRKLYVEVIKVNNNLLEKNGSMPTANEIAKELNTPVRDIEDVLMSGQKTLSLDEIFAEGCSSDDILLNDKKSVSTEINEKLCEEDLKEKLNKFFIETLTPRQYQIIKLKYGFNGRKPLTNTEISKILGTTSSNIHEHELRIFRKLKKSYKFKQIYENYIKENE